MKKGLFFVIFLLGLVGQLVSFSDVGWAANDVQPFPDSYWVLDPTFGLDGTVWYRVTGYMQTGIDQSRLLLWPNGKLLVDLDYSWSDGRIHSQSSQILRYSSSIAAIRAV